MSSNLRGKHIKNNAIVWEGECEGAFRKIKEICTSSSILVYADFSRPLKLDTDACTVGLGRILYQNQDGVHHVIGYASGSLRHKLEFLALKWAMMKQFHKYLYSNNLVIYTDNHSLTYILTSAKLDATGHQRAASLANYNFSLSYQ